MDDRPRSLFNELDLDWCRFARSGSARCSLQRWRRLEPVFAAFESVETLLAGLRSRTDLDHRDVVWFALLRIARTDTDARRVALFALWPGLNVVAQRYAELVYDGLWFTPLREAIDAFVAVTQKRVSGDVRVKLYKGNTIVTGRRSPYSLYSEDFATFGASAEYDHADAEGFITLFGLPLKVAALSPSPDNGK